MKFKLDLFNIIVIIFMVYVIYRLPSLEQMSNVDKATEDKIREIYKIDTDAIRNLSNLAKDLTVNGKLTVPGGLEIKGDLKVDGNSEVLKQTTIHELYGGKSTWGGWRDIIVNGGHLMFNVGNKGYGFHSNDNALHYKINNQWKPLHVWSGVHSIGNLSTNGDLVVHGNINCTKGLVVNDLHKPWGDRGLHVKHNDGRWTHFNWLDNGQIYLRGTTNIDGSVNTNTINLGGNRIRNLGDRIGFKNATSSGCCSNPEMEHKEFAIDFDAGAEHLRFWGKKDNRRIRGRWGRDADSW
jgi:hypothetical protein